MKNTANPSRELPTLEQLEMELDREKYKKRYRRVLRSAVYTLVVVAAVAVLVATIWMPVLQIYGASMTPTLNEGDIVLSVKGSDCELGDLVAFYMGNKILVKRCIAGPGQWVDIDVEGNVYVDGNLLDEPYLTENPWGIVTLICPTRYRTIDTSAWAITGPPRWIPAALRWAASPVNKSSEKSYSGSGR